MVFDCEISIFAGIDCSLRHLYQSEYRFNQINIELNHTSSHLINCDSSSSPLIVNHHSPVVRTLLYAMHPQDTVNHTRIHFYCFRWKLCCTNCTICPLALPIRQNEMIIKDLNMEMDQTDYTHTRILVTQCLYHISAFNSVRTNDHLEQYIVSMNPSIRHSIRSVVRCALLRERLFFFNLFRREIGHVNIQIIWFGQRMELDAMMSIVSQVEWLC